MYVIIGLCMNCKCAALNHYGQVVSITTRFSLPLLISIDLLEPDFDCCQAGARNTLHGTMNQKM